MAKFDTLTVHAGYTGRHRRRDAGNLRHLHLRPTGAGRAYRLRIPRSANPTRTALESAIAELEGGSRGYAFASGLAACSTVLELLDKDSHLIAVDDLYGGTYRLLEKVRSRTAGLRVTYVSPADLAGLEQAIEPDTKMIWVETPTNPLLKLADLSAIAAIAKSMGSSAWRTIPSPRRICSARWIWALTWWCTPPPNTSTATPTWWPASRRWGITRRWRNSSVSCKTRSAAFSIRSAAS